MNDSTRIALALAIVALIIRRQLRTRPVRETASLIGLGVLAVLGAFAVAFGVMSVTKYHPVPATAWLLITLSLAIGIAFGLARARTVRVWRDTATGTVLRKGSAWTVGLWLVSLAVHFGMDAWIDQVTKAGFLGVSTIYAYVAVTLGAQFWSVRRRAAAPAG
ncbi:hypothetical protein ACIHFE_01970 [Streptomyces sp. NPDC052396]|uniref:hypothetical protein n=1 Tax=Streptomyces sp. NPDC052396 TaxID=3365689 RepID=UPI0037D50598